MAKRWYPVVDILTCIECGTCIYSCPHSVYEKAKAPSPMVVNHERCVDHCHECGNHCPVGAITYVGEDTDWMPPAFGKSSETDSAPGCGCGCSCGGGCE